MRTHAPDQIPPGASGVCLVHQVFAGCRQSLLGDGPSRHYLCDPCVGARTLTPPRPPGAHAHFFPGDFGLTLRERRSARESLLQAASCRTPISGLQSFVDLRAPTLARPPGCSHRSDLGPLGGQAVHTTHRPGGCPFRDVASLHVRHGQLTWLDLHQLDRSLVGCSLPQRELILESTRSINGPEHSRSRSRFSNQRVRSTARSTPGAGVDSRA